MFNFLPFLLWLQYIGSFFRPLLFFSWLLRSISWIDSFFVCHIYLNTNCREPLIIRVCLGGLGSSPLHSTSQTPLQRRCSGLVKCVCEGNLFQILISIGGCCKISGVPSLFSFPFQFFLATCMIITSFFQPYVCRLILFYGLHMMDKVSIVDILSFLHDSW
jgi:hypothetical protein